PRPSRRNGTHGFLAAVRRIRMTSIGKTYNMPPQPADDDATTYLDAGAVSIGVEYRVVDPDSLRETYKHDAAQLAELEERSPEGGFYAEGLSLHVVAKADGHEY